MKKPNCPRAPKKPEKPKKFKKDLTRVGRRGGWTNKVNVADFVERMKRAAARKRDCDPEDISLEQLYIYDYSLSFYVSSGELNPKFDEEMKKYSEEKLPKYKAAMARYEKRMKQYHINKELWDAWQLKKQEDELRDQLKRVTACLKEVETKRQALVDSKD